MTKLHTTAVIGALLAISASVAVASTTKRVSLKLGPGAVLNVTNPAGSVVLRPGTDQQVIVNATIYSGKVEMDAYTTPDGKRGEVISHAVGQQRPTGDEARVDYDITVPSGISVTISTATAPVTVEGVKGDISISSDTGLITVRQMSKSHLHVRGVAAPVVLSDVVNTHVDITSATGSVQLTQVSGPNVEVRTTKGPITYTGDFGGGGRYTLSTHDADIDVHMPEIASVDLTARSPNGSVDTPEFLKQKEHTTFAPSQGRSFTGTSHSGSSSVELHSYSGRIRVKKQ